MTTPELASREVTQTLRDENAHAMPDGWRKTLPILQDINTLTQTGTAIAADKRGAIVAVKRVAAHIGLKAADLLLLDTLAAFTPPQDWEQGRQPIVWPSNAYLMAQTGFSLSTLKRHARRLADIGVLSFKDSPNGKRWGRRDKNGHIVEAYGFDLSPLAARQHEFEALAQQLQHERALCQRLKRQITICRRTIRALLQIEEPGAQTQTHKDCAATFEALLLQLPKRQTHSSMLKHLLDMFVQLLNRIEGLHVETSETENETSELGPKGAKNEPHIQTLNQLKSNPCKAPATEQAPAPPNRYEVPLRTLIQTCTEFTSWAKTMNNYVTCWADLANLIDLLRPMIGVSDETWYKLQTHLGTRQAITAFAFTFEKHCEQKVLHPNGYLKGMLKKAELGKLNLAQSFFGRLSRLST